MSARSRRQDGESLATASGDLLGPQGRLQLLTFTGIREAAIEGMTAHEVSIATGFDRHSIQPRISELQRKGLVIASGKRRCNPSGKTAIVWIASEYADATPQSPGAP